MSRKPTLTKHPNADMHAIFTAAVTSLGMRVDPRTARIHNVLVDGEPIGARLGELRKPETSFYMKSYAEANAVAHLAVNLDLDLKGTVDVLRLAEPEPDTKLTLDGATLAFVEQTVVTDQAAHRLTLDVEAINSALRACTEPDVVAAFASGMLTLRFNDIPDSYYETGLPIDAIVHEIIALTRSFNGAEQRSIDPNASSVPFLAGMKAVGSYRLNGATASPVMTLVDHGRSDMVGDLLTERLQDKRKKAPGYPDACRPLWLLIDIDHHFGYNDFTSVARSVVERERPTEYDRIIVAQTYAKPRVFDYPRA
jgi:hypothetical protein